MEPLALSRLFMWRALFSCQYGKISYFSHLHFGSHINPFYFPDPFLVFHIAWYSANTLIILRCCCCHLNSVVQHGKVIYAVWSSIPTSWIRRGRRVHEWMTYTCSNMAPSSNIGLLSLGPGGVKRILLPFTMKTIEELYHLCRMASM